MLGGGGPATTPVCRRALSVCHLYPLPVGDETDFDMGYSQSKLTVDLCVNVLVRPTYAYFAAPVRGRKACSTIVPLRGVTGGCKARPDLRLRTAVWSAA